MDDSIPIPPLQPTVAAYQGLGDDEYLHESSSIDRNGANVRTRRVPAQHSLTKPPELAVMDRWSDSGYSSYGARTISSIGSTSSLLGAALPTAHSPSTSFQRSSSSTIAHLPLRTNHSYTDAEGKIRCDSDGRSITQDQVHPGTSASNKSSTVASDAHRKPPMSYKDPYASKPTSRRRSSRPKIPSSAMERYQKDPNRDRYLLKKLDAKVDHITKQEKRARVLEAELAAQERVEADMRARRAARSAAAQQETVSTSMNMKHPEKLRMSKRHHVATDRARISRELQSERFKDRTQKSQPDTATEDTLLSGLNLPGYLLAREKNGIHVSRSPHYHRSTSGAQEPTSKPVRGSIKPEQQPSPRTFIFDLPQAQKNKDEAIAHQPKTTESPSNNISNDTPSPQLDGAKSFQHPTPWHNLSNDMHQSKSHPRNNEHVSDDLKDGFSRSPATSRDQGKPPSYPGLQAEAMSYQKYEKASKYVRQLVHTVMQHDQMSQDMENSRNIAAADGSVRNRRRSLLQNSLRDNDNDGDTGLALLGKKHQQNASRCFDLKPFEAIPSTFVKCEETSTASSGDDQARLNETSGAGSKATFETSDARKESGLLVLIQDEQSIVSSPKVDTSYALHTSPCQLDTSGDASSSGESCWVTSQGNKDFTSLGSHGKSDSPSDAFEVNVEDALSTALNVVKNLLLQELLDYAASDGTDVPQSPNDALGEIPGISTSSSLESSTVHSGTPMRSKRARESGRDPGDDDEDNSEDDDRPKKKGGKGPPDRSPMNRRLKCPFHQRDPAKYSKAACRGSGFADMAKLKDHIKRVHTQPLRCFRCWIILDSDDAYLKHQQQEVACLKRPEPHEDRILPQVLKRLNFKRAPYSNARNVEEKWKMLFRVLFPNDKNVPSPYEQQVMSPQLERALCEALEEQLTNELAHIMEPIMTRIKDRIPAIIESCREKLKASPSTLEDEALFTPSGTSSVTGSSKSGSGSSTKRNRAWTDSVTSFATSLATSSGSDFASGEPHALAAIVEESPGNIAQHTISCTAFPKAMNLQDIISLGTDMGYDTRGMDEHDLLCDFQEAPEVNECVALPTSTQRLAPNVGTEVSPESSKKTIRRKANFLLPNRHSSFHGSPGTHDPSRESFDCSTLSWPVDETGWGTNNTMREISSTRHLESESAALSPRFEEWDAFMREFQ